MSKVDPRVRFSLERTLLSWIRTSIALMGFGFLVARFSPPFNGAHDSGQGDFAMWIGVVLILVGIFVNLAANYTFHTNLKRLNEGLILQEGHWSLGKSLSIILSLLSLAMVVHLILKY